MSNKIYIADKTTLDNLVSIIGTTNNTGGSSSAGTVNAKLNSLISTLSTVNTNASNASSYASQANTNASNASSYSNTAKTQIGSSSDSASQTGTSLQSKTKYIANTLSSLNSTINTINTNTSAGTKVYTPSNNILFSGTLKSATGGTPEHSNPGTVINSTTTLGALCVMSYPGIVKINGVIPAYTTGCVIITIGGVSIPRNVHLLYNQYTKRAGGTSLTAMTGTSGEDLLSFPTYMYRISNSNSSTANYETYLPVAPGSIIMGAMWSNSSTNVSIKVCGTISNANSTGVYSLTSYNTDLTPVYRYSS